MKEVQTMTTDQTTYLAELWQQITDERRRAHVKHAEHSMEGLDKWSGARLPVLVEEVGEVARALNDLALDSADGDLRSELVQVAAMAVAWIAALDDNPLEPELVPEPSPEEHRYFSNNTDGSSWLNAWCAVCHHDHGTHNDREEDPMCPIVARSMAGLRNEEWHERTGPPFHLPPDIVCDTFTPCHQPGCSGDPHAEARAVVIRRVMAADQ